VGITLITISTFTKKKHARWKQNGIYLKIKKKWPPIAKQFEYYIYKYIKQTFEKHKSNNFDKNVHHNKTRDSVGRACVIHLHFDCFEEN
jgi:hypothetical protein